jgi:hypothetical protein
MVLRNHHEKLKALQKQRGRCCGPFVGLRVAIYIILVTNTWIGHSEILPFPNGTAGGKP